MQVITEIIEKKNHLERWAVTESVGAVDGGRRALPQDVLDLVRAEPSTDPHVGAVEHEKQGRSRLLRATVSPERRWPEATA